MDKRIKALELFAGVGGFRLGLEGQPESDGQRSTSGNYEVVWSNQWEPSTKRQHANEVYVARFGKKGHNGNDIATVDINDIPNHELLVGGFPCQDYSVATSLNSSKGLQGKKGVLWWQIERIIREKGKNAPNYLMLENVDRLLKSPANQRGRDFAVMLASLGQQGYAVEWRVINAADYGMPQRRRRIFILAYKKGTKLYNDLKSAGIERWMRKESLFQDTFPAEIKASPLSEPNIIQGELNEISEKFNKGAKRTSPSPFDKTGVYLQGEYVTSDIEVTYDGPYQTLGDILVDLKDVPEEFIILKDKSVEKYLEDYESTPKSVLQKHPQLQKWIENKGAKRKEKVNKDGVHYVFSEGRMVFPDPADKPSRTIITAEGGKTASRFKHTVIQNDVLRRLTPVELERLNMFPDNHTQLEGVTNSKRAFFMGNALVVGVVERLGKALAIRRD
jgi:DNA (cytosine-5)-methyltransferase 1